MTAQTWAVLAAAATIVGGLLAMMRIDRRMDRRDALRVLAEAEAISAARNRHPSAGPRYTWSCECGAHADHPMRTPQDALLDHELHQLLDHR